MILLIIGIIAFFLFLSTELGEIVIGSIILLGLFLLLVFAFVAFVKFSWGVL